MGTFIRLARPIGGCYKGAPSEGATTVRTLAGIIAVSLLPAALHAPGAEKDGKRLSAPTLENIDGTEKVIHTDTFEYG